MNYILKQTTFVFQDSDGKTWKAVWVNNPKTDNTTRRYHVSIFEFDTYKTGYYSDQFINKSNSLDLIRKTREILI